MQTLADRAAQSLAHHPAPALPLDELVHEMKLGGAVVGPDVLLRALEARPDLFRVLDPWRGPWRSASPRGGKRVGTHWVVGLGQSAREGGTAGRLKASLAQLGRTVDERSVTDLVRWLGMVREGERLSRSGALGSNA
ncbi:MAG: hypothetical protein EXR95_10790 [Gemmatimonadetes bacterium]|nr:hypothetical protein [Gemmatimonadota bacterium]